MPVIAFAQAGGGPNVVWNSALSTTETDPGFFTTTGSFNVSGADLSTLVAFIFSDSDPDFEPPDSMAFLGPVPTSGNINFSYGGGADQVYFLAVVVDSASYSGGTFSPFVDQSSFQTIGFGPVAQTSTTTGGNNQTNNGGNNQTNNGGNNQTNNSGNVQVPADPQINATLNNPLGQTFELTDFFQKLFEGMLKIGIPILALLIIWSGFMFVEARGNIEKLKVAKRNFMYVMIGGAILLGSWLIVQVIAGTVDQFQAMNYLLEDIIKLV